MELKEIAQKAKDLSPREMDREFRNYFARNRERFRHLDENNRDLIMDIIEDHRRKAMRGVDVSERDIEREYHRLWQRRLDLGLKEQDLDFVKEVLSWMRKEKD